MLLGVKKVARALKGIRVYIIINGVLYGIINFNVKFLNIRQRYLWDTSLLFSLHWNFHLDIICSQK